MSGRPARSENRLSESIRVDSGPETISLVVARLDEFADAWNRGPEPDIHDYLHDAGPLRFQLLTELIILDLQFRWAKHREAKPVAEYVSEFTELAGDALPAELVMEEMHVRQQAGLADSARTLDVLPPELAGEAAIPDTAHRRISNRSLNHARRPESIPVGSQLGDFRILAHIGQGAFADVFLAAQQSIGHRRVALKVSGDVGNEPDNLGQLKHECIVEVHGIERLPQRGLRLLCMGFVPGGTLQDVVEQVRSRPVPARSGALLIESVDQSLASHGESPPIDSIARERLRAADWTDAVCWIGIRLARGLAYAHSKGVLHRDIKPANVLLDSACHPKLADFNTSFNSQDGTTPAEAFFGGSLAYMSPEQLEACLAPWMADRLDGRSDLFSLGVLLWELAQGERPWNEEDIGTDWHTTINKMLERRRQAPQLDAPSHAEWVPWEVCQVLRHCLEADVTLRCDSASHLVRRLEMCRNPELRRMFYPRPRSWRILGSRYAVWILLVTGIFPNALLAVFNHQYNAAHIAVDLHAETQLEWLSTRVVNPVAFAIGSTLVLLWYLLPGTLRGSPGKHSENGKRRICLRIGSSTAILGILVWTIAGALYPACIHLLSMDDSRIEPVMWEHYLHFISSHVLCGAIAAVYVYFLMTELAIGLAYPALLRNNIEVDQDKSELRRTQATALQYLLLAAMIPLIALLGMTTVGSASPYMQVLSCAGVLGVALAFRSYLAIQKTIASLLEIS